MSPVRMSAGGRGEAMNRRLIAQKYLEVAELAASEEGGAVNNVVVGVAVLAGIAAGDAICLTALGERYAGTDHSEAVSVLRRVARELADHLAKLVRLKPPSHYGNQFVSTTDRTAALRAARKLVEAATERTSRAG